MILVDRQIKEANKIGNLISDGFAEENLNSVSYDLTVDCELDSCDKNNL